MFRPLDPWLDRKAPIPTRFHSVSAKYVIDDGWFGWVVLEESYATLLQLVRRRP
jgi:hypothetical protein